MKTLENISLKELNTFGIDVRARRLVIVEREEDLAALTLEEPYFILGGGSNMVFTADYEGTVIQLERRSEVELLPEGRVRAWGGMVMDELVAYCIDNKRYGLENLTAIPGSVGASVVQNVGAYGVEAKDVVESVDAYDLREHRMCRFPNEECRFAYRYSRFKDEPGRYLILRVVYYLHSEYTPVLNYKALKGLPYDSAEALRQAIADLRWGKLPRPEEHGSAGSFFKNPVVDEDVYQSIRAMHPDMPEAHRSEEGYKLSAGWLIDRAGWKGRTVGAAGVWPKQALVLYNAGGCIGQEVVTLAHAIQEDVKKQFGVTLDPEAIII